MGPRRAGRCVEELARRRTSRPPRTRRVGARGSDCALRGEPAAAHGRFSSAASRRSSGSSPYRRGLRIEVEARGVAGHSSIPDSGRSASSRSSTTDDLRALRSEHLDFRRHTIEHRVLRRPAPTPRENSRRSDLRTGEPIETLSRTFVRGEGRVSLAAAPSDPSPSLSEGERARSSFRLRLASSAGRGASRSCSAPLDP